MSWFFVWWRKRRLRRAQEQLAYWKAQQEVLDKCVHNSAVMGMNPHNHNRLIHASGQAAKYLERVEIYMRES